MVILHVKQGDQNQFLFETSVSVKIDELIKIVVSIHNGRLKIERLCSEIDDLSKHGVTLPIDMQGLSQDQIIDLKLRDEWTESFIRSNDYLIEPDPIGRRNGKAPIQKQKDILSKTVAEAKSKISKKLVDANMNLKIIDIKEALDMLKGAIMIAYPMGLPAYEPVQLELENKDLTGKQAVLEVLEENSTDLWWAGKRLEPNKQLQDYVGRNEKTKIVVKLQKRGLGPPGREPVLTEDQRKELMLAEYKKREELRKLDEDDDDDSYLNSPWADNKMLQKSFHGLTNIQFR